MKKITLICVGSLKEPYLKAAFDEYKKRISKFFDFQVIEINEAKLQKNNSTEIKRVIDLEGENLAKKVNSGQVFPLCIEGEQMSSVEFAQLVDKSSDMGEVVFVIGGSYGLSDKIKQLGKKVSFGKLTYPHQLMRIMFLEQLYRAGTILNNVEYHK